MIERHSNLVYFRVQGGETDSPSPSGGDADQTPPDVRVSLKLDRPWTITAGLRPDVNSAIITWREFDKLRDGTVSVMNINAPLPLRKIGDIEFYYTTTDTPDRVEKDIELIDVEAVRRGTVRMKDPANPQSPEAAVNRIVMYRLWFADRRHRVQPPRGGVLTDGFLNADPAPDQQVSGVYPDHLLKNSELIRRCMGKLGKLYLSGAPGSPGPEAADAFPPLRNLEWFAAHPLKELARLLEYTGHAFCLTEDPAGFIQKIGSGDEPSIPEDRELPTLELPGLDRRGKTVIITSAPTPIYETYTSDASSGPVWIPVATDANGKWKHLLDIEELGGAPALRVREHFSTVADQSRRLQLYKECYRFWQLSELTFPSRHCPLSRKQFRPRQTQSESQPADNDLRDIRVVARTAIWDNATWKNSDNPVEIPVIWLGGPNVIYLENRLGLLATSGTAADMDEDFVEQLDFKVEFTVESWDPQFQEKDYLVFGFKQELDQVIEIERDEAKALLRGGGESTDDVVVIRMPELVYVRKDGNDNSANRNALRDLAKTRAMQILKGSGDKIKSRAATGFLAGECSGRVSRIDLDQQALTTTFYIDAWAMPGAAVRDDGSKRGGSSAFAGDRDTQQQRTYLGGSGERQPAVPVAPSGNTPNGRLTLVRITGNRDKAGTYSMTVIGSPSAAFSSGAGTLAAADFGAAGAVGTAINPHEEGKTTHLITEAPQSCFVFAAMATGARDSAAGNCPVYILVGGLDLAPCET